ncbi:Arylsulfatase [Symmachiella macrocystis]|uniref:Arylsulfatase n=1 Tax=Symmachiella macrocystis TaxID=2527985 RepID=A0A5C6BNZ0_9PLAN|nr:arylsulfatase [Symmachiella macrocystis]TWU12986.1 Arylsulfatase [Symmachiella macrocystis]
MKTQRFRIYCTLALGVLFGYVAADSNTEVDVNANAATPEVTVGETASPVAVQGDLSNQFAHSNVVLPAAQAVATSAAGQAKKQPNIIMIMGDDIGMWNIGAYHRGMMAGRTPNIDQLAREGAIFTDYYAEASCTAGRANFITGQLPIRTGLTTVGQAGAKIGMPAAAPTIATVLKDMGYATGQFGKNHLGDRNEFLPTLHGFDEFFGYLYHLDAMEDPFHPGYPQELKEKYGPRNLLHTWATDKDDTTVDPRWGKVGKQKIVDEGPLPPHPIKGIKHNMEDVDDEILKLTLAFIDKAHAEGKPFFVWLNPTRMHVVTHLNEKYEGMRTAENEWTIEEAGMAQFDDVVGAVMAHLKKIGVADNTIVGVTTDNGTENFTWPDGGQTPFAGAKGMVQEGGFRVPMVLRWPGTVKPNQVINGVMSGMDWLPTFVAAAGNPDINEELKQGKKLNGKEYKVHLDGYDQTDMLSTGAKSARNELWYFAESSLGAARVGNFKYTFLNQPDGWFGPKVSAGWPGIVNLRLDPFERTTIGQSMAAYNWWAYEFWRFVFVQEEVAKLAKTAIEFPPMQEGASFNLDAIKKKLADHAAALSK